MRETSPIDTVVGPIFTSFFERRKNKKVLPELAFVYLLQSVLKKETFRIEIRADAGTSTMQTKGEEDRKVFWIYLIGKSKTFTVRRIQRGVRSLHSSERDCSIIFILL